MNHCDTEERRSVGLEVVRCWDRDHGRGGVPGEINGILSLGALVSGKSGVMWLKKRFFRGFMAGVRFLKGFNFEEFECSK